MSYLSINNTIVSSPMSFQFKQKASSNTKNESFQNEVIERKNPFVTPYLSNISFGRSIQEHKSWGANVQKDGSVSFKIWANNATHEGRNKKVKNVFVEIAPYKKTQNLKFEDGFIEFSYDENGLDVKSTDGDSTVIKLKKTSEGIFEGNTQKAKSGDNYRYILEYNDGTIQSVKDPNSKRQDGVYKWSTIYDHNDFKWDDEKWMHVDNPKKIGRKNGGLLPTISEIHVGVIDEKGNFDSVKKKIDEYSQKGTFNTIELMPVEGCFFDPSRGLGYNWGYDGVDKHAPTQTYGGPDKLKELINYAHKRGINMIIDMVPNHMGAYGNILPLVADYENKNVPGPWGMPFNYDGKDSRYVRDYMVNAALNWLKNYHFDGIRFDATTNMHSEYTMKQIAKECHFHAPNSYLICEDFSANPGDGNKLCNAAVIIPSTEGEEEIRHAHDYKVKEEIHCNIIDEISKNNTNLKRLDFDSQWDFPFHHFLDSILMNREENGYYPSLQDFMFTFRNGPFNTKYFMSHDEVGNHSGTRLVTKLLANKLNISKRIPPYNEAENWRQMAESSQAFVRAKDDKNNVVWTPEYQRNKFNILTPVSYNEFSGAFKESNDLNKVALATIFIAPGPKMIFDGDEKGSIDRFKFFAQHENPMYQDGCSREKGYDTGLDAFLDSKQNNYKNSFDKETENLSEELFKLFNSSKALQSQQNDNKHFSSYVYDKPRVAQVIRREGNDEVLAVMNFGDSDFNEFILNDITDGKWRQVISTKESAPNNGKVVSQFGHMNIKLPKQSVIIFRKEN